MFQGILFKLWPFGSAYTFLEIQVTENRLLNLEKTMTFVYKWLQPGNLVILMLVSKCQLQPLFFKIYVAVSYVTRLWSLKYSSLSSFFVAIAFLKEAFDGLSLVVFVFFSNCQIFVYITLRTKSHLQLFSLTLLLRNSYL